jgi:hypothetical protein
MLGSWDRRVPGLTHAWSLGPIPFRCGCGQVVLGQNVAVPVAGGHFVSIRDAARSAMASGGVEALGRVAWHVPGVLGELVAVGLACCADAPTSRISTCASTAAVHAACL